MPKPKEQQRRPKVGSSGCSATDSTTPCRAACRLDLTIFAVVCMYEAEELTEGQAVKLMNCPSRVEFRLLREKLHRNFRASLAADMKANGWEWQNDKLSDSRPL